MDALPFPPELMQPPPRKVVRRTGPRGIGCMALFMVPHTLAGIGMLIWFACALAVYVAVYNFGERFPGEIVSLTTGRGGKGTTKYYVQFRYEVGGAPYFGWDAVSSTVYHQLKAGQKIEVLALSSHPTWGAQPGIEGDSAWAAVVFLGLFSLIWNAVMAVLLWVLVVVPLRLRKLVQVGQPTVGTILGTETRAAKPRTYWAHYQFETAPVSAEHPPLVVKGKCTVPKEMFASMKNGERVTVLYDPKRPQRNLVYEYANYRAVAPV